MTKAEHINYWTKNADRDWQRAKNNFKLKDYVFCLFCLHMSLEKICKALWV
ncbi:MAG: HEPN domain-containing protein [Chitinophagales bacterium]|nr:HEPN domain-containing protein [Chitinophagales bacterium]